MICYPAARARTLVVWQRKGYGNDLSLFKAATRANSCAGQSTAGERSTSLVRQNEGSENPPPRPTLPRTVDNMGPLMSWVIY